MAGAAGWPLRQQPGPPQRQIEPHRYSVAADGAERGAVQAVGGRVGVARQLRDDPVGGAGEVADAGRAVIDHQATAPLHKEALGVLQSGVGAGEHGHLGATEPVLHLRQGRRLTIPARQVAYCRIAGFHCLQRQLPRHRRPPGFPRSTAVSLGPDGLLEEVVIALHHGAKLLFFSAASRGHPSASASVDSLHRVAQQVGHRSAMDDGDRRPHECRHRLVVAYERGEAHVPFIDVEDDMSGHEP